MCRDMETTLHSPTPLRLFLLGEFASGLLQWLTHDTTLNVTLQRVSSVDHLPRRLGDSDLLLTEFLWLNELPITQRTLLSQRAISAAAWITITHEGALFKEQITWLRLGVSHFFEQPLDRERLKALIDELQERRSGPPIRTIVLDDDKSSLFYYSQILLHADIDVLATQDPVLLLEALDIHRPDVLVLDIELLGCRGTELATLVRQRTAHARLPIIFLTAMTSLSDKLQARSVAAEDYLAKPVAPDLLIASVKAHALRYRALQREEAWHQRQQARSRLRLEQLRMAIDEHAIVSITDAQGCIVYANDKFCAISGYTREELLGQTHCLVKSGLHDQAFYAEMWQTITQGKVWHGEICNRRKNDGYYWVEATIYPIFDSAGRPQQYISIRTDITPLKMRESALRVAEERLRRAQNYANIGAWDWNIETGELYWSERIAPLFGYAEGALETSYENFLAAVHPEDRQRVITAIAASIDENLPYEVEHRVVRPDGTIRWLLERGAVTRHDDGKAIKMLGIVQDITDRKNTEFALIDAREAAERANQAKSDFLSSMSHELRTPLNAILGFAQILDCDDVLNADQHDNVQEIIKAGRHLLDLINQVLDLAKIEAGQVDLTLEPVLLEELIETCRQLIQPLIDQADLTLMIDVPADCAYYARADRLRLKQVLINLLSNAVKYNRRGGTVRIAVATAAAPQCLRIEISDTGRGIAPEHLKSLFQPFNRLGLTGIEGTGIGLSISRRLVEMMGGEIGVRSTLGEGSTFWVELPRHDEPKDDNIHVSDDHAANPSALTRATLLAIDDNPVNLKLLARIIGRLPEFSFISAHTPEIGLQKATAHRPDVILLDITMPGMDGYQVLATLKGNPALRHIPVIAVTANAMPHDIERGLAAGFHDYLTKPIDLDKLRCTLQNCLALRETPP